MSGAHARQIAWLREIHGTSLKALQDWGIRLATWLVAGNAAALLLGFNSIVGGSACEASALAALMWPFAIGLGLSFGGGVASFLIGTSVTKLLGDATNALAHIEMNEESLAEIEAQHGPQPANSPLPASIAEQNAKIPVLLAKLDCERKTAQRILWLYGLAMLAFTFGVLSPAISGLLLEACSR